MTGSGSPCGTQRDGTPRSPSLQRMRILEQLPDGDRAILELDRRKA
jgi:hypothetical protein